VSVVGENAKSAIAAATTALDVGAGVAAGAAVGRGVLVGVGAGVVGRRIAVGPAAPVGVGVGVRVGVGVAGDRLGEAEGGVADSPPVPPGTTEVATGVADAVAGGSVAADPAGVRPVVPPVGPVPTCPPGSTPDKPGPVGQARPPTFEMSMAFDRAAAPGPTWSGRMWSYDAGPGAWQPVAQDEQLSAETGRQLLLAYDQSVGRLVSYSLDGEVRLFDLRTGTWSAPGAESPPFTYATPMMNPFSFGGEIAYDEAARRTVLFSSGAAIAYDAAVDRWQTLCGGSIACAIPPECRTSPHMVYDPVHERLVVYGGVFCTGDYWYRVFVGYGAPDEVLAFDTRTREWTVLVERRSTRPALY
jgi:hypothetical protein